MSESWHSWVGKTDGRAHGRGVVVVNGVAYHVAAIADDLATLDAMYAAIKVYERDYKC